MLYNQKSDMEPRISVCIATYNGAKWINAQLESILTQLSPWDEVLIIDDCSRDDTVEIIKKVNDPRIKLHENTVNRGVCDTFSRAIELATGEFIFLADQDDVWQPQRIANMLEEMMRDNVLLLSTAFNFFGDNLTEDYSKNFKFLNVEDSNKNFKNIVNILLGRASYFGCAMAFHKSLRSVVVPIPNYVQSHDLWIAKAANLCGRNGHSNIVSLSRRIHGENLSVVSNSILTKLYARVVFFLSLVHLFGRVCMLKFSKKSSIWRK